MSIDDQTDATPAPRILAHDDAQYEYIVGDEPLVIEIVLPED